MPRRLVRNFTTSIQLNTGYILNSAGGAPGNNFGAFTVVGWMRANVQSGNSFFSMGNSSNVTPFFRVYSSGSGQLVLQWRNDNNTFNSNLAGANYVYDGNFHHIAVTHDGSGGVKVYVDGVQDPVNFNITPSGVLTLDCIAFGTLWRGSTTGSMTGQLLDCRTYASALTQAQINTIMNGGSPGVGSYQHWPLDEGSGTTANDVAAGNARPGTINAGVWTSSPLPSIARLLAAIKTTARNIFTTLLLNGSTSTISGTAISGLGSGCTVAGWFKVPNITGQYNLFGNGVGASESLNVQITNVGLAAAFYNGASVGPVSAGQQRMTPGQWMHFVYTYDGATTGTLLLNGVQVADGTTGPVVAGTGLRLGSRPDNNRKVLGNLSQFLVYNRAISVAEAQALYASGAIPANPLNYWPLNEGAGAIAYDLGSAPQNLTISAASFVQDVPFKKRLLVNDNMIFNGDFEYAPKVNVAQNTGGSKYIDGTSGGSSTNTNFGGWNMSGNTDSTDNVMFSSTNPHSGSNCMSLATGGAGHNLELHNYPGFQGTNQIPVQPNTSYTLTGWFNVKSYTGSAATGVRFGVYYSIGNGTLNGNTFTPVGSITGVTGGWVQLSLTFTTPANTAWLNPMIRIIGADGAGTLQIAMDVDDIVLLPATAPVRALAT